MKVVETEKRVRFECVNRWDVVLMRLVRSVAHGSKDSARHWAAFRGEMLLGEQTAHLLRLNTSRHVSGGCTLSISIIDDVVSF
jgi:hypothetical protein